jgi:hypothetical protein
MRITSTFNYLSFTCFNHASSSSGISWNLNELQTVYIKKCSVSFDYGCYLYMNVYFEGWDAMIGYIYTRLMVSQCKKYLIIFCKKRKEANFVVGLFIKNAWVIYSIILLTSPKNMNKYYLLRTYSYKCLPTLRLQELWIVKKYIFNSLFTKIFWHY